MIIDGAFGPGNPPGPDVPADDRARRCLHTLWGLAKEHPSSYHKAWWTALQGAIEDLASPAQRPLVHPVVTCELCGCATDGSSPPHFDDCASFP